MRFRRFIALGAILSIGSIYLTGCAQSPARKAHPEWNASPSAQQEPADNPQKTLTPTQAGPGGRKVDQMDANAASIEALRRKTESYAGEVTPLILARPGTQPPPAPSQVRFEDTAANFNLTPQAVGAPERRSDGAAAMIGMIAQAEPSHIAPMDGPVGGSRSESPKAEVASAAPNSDVMPRVSAPARSAVPPSSDALAERLSKRVKDYPRDVSTQLEYQLLQFLKDEPTPELSKLSSLPPEDRELLTAMLDGLSNFRNALRADANMLFSNKIKPITEMSERLSRQADLTIPTIRLCSRVTTFGIYDPIEPARFAAGRDEQVIVYCEVANFASTLNDKQMWETRLTWDMTLYSEQGMSVWSDKTEAISDASRIRRHDFFVRKAITLPHTLPIGRYLLKVSIVDTQSNRVAEATTALGIAAQ